MTDNHQVFLTKIKLFVFVSITLLITSMSNVCFCLEENPPADDNTKKDAKPEVVETPKEVVIQMYDNYFSPSSVTVVTGQRVIWVNRGRCPHNVSIRGYFSSGDIPPGGSTSYVFKKDGIYDALCSAHAFMFAGMIVHIKVS